MFPSGEIYHPFDSFILAFDLDVQALDQSPRNVLISSELLAVLADGADRDLITSQYQAQLGGEEVLTQCCALLKEALAVLSLPAFPADKITGHCNRGINDDEVRDWLLERLREFKLESIRYARERMDRRLRVTPLPSGVELPSIPVC